MTVSDVSELTARLAKLERYHRSLRRLGVAALCLLPVGLGAFASGSGPVVRAEQFELITANGIRQATLEADSAGVTLTLFTTKGRPVLMLLAREMPSQSRGWDPPDGSGPGASPGRRAAFGSTRTDQFVRAFGKLPAEARARSTEYLPNPPRPAPVTG
jgi:hypothetical protein